MVRILSVEDNFGDARLIEETLRQSSTFEVDLTYVGRLSDAANHLAQQPTDVVLLDLSLPDSQGLEGLSRLQAVSPNVPIIVLSGMADKALALDAVKQGAQDYLMKDTINADMLTRIIQYSIERKMAEERYRSLVENIPGVIYACQDDPEWTMTFLGPSFEGVTGYSLEEFGAVRSNQYFPLIHPDDQDLIRRVILGAVTRHQPYSVEYRIKDKDNTTHWVLDRGRVLSGLPADLLYRNGILFDITQQKQMEERLQRTNQRLHQAKHFEALGSLAGGIAHDFNNLITAINGYADLILERLAPESGLHAHLAEIRKASGRAMTITQQLLSLNQSTATQEVALVDLNFIVQDVKRMLQLVIGPTRRINLISEPILARIRANPQQLEQVLLILAANLTEGQSQDTDLQIEMTSQDVSKDDAERVGASYSGQSVTLTMKVMPSADTQEDHGWTFVPVVSDSEVVRELGFGIATVLRIVTEHGGYIQASRPSNQTRAYKIVFPPGAASERDIFLCTAQPASRRRGTETILVVEDEECVRVLVQEVLEGNGYMVLAASDGFHAIQLSEQCEGNIDLLIADEDLPGMNGSSVAERLLRQRPELPIIHMSTTNPDQDHRFEATALHRQFLVKPFTTGMLLDRVSTVLDERRQQHSRVS